MSTDESSISDLYVHLLLIDVFMKKISVVKADKTASLKQGLKKLVYPIYSSIPTYLISTAQHDIHNLEELYNLKEKNIGEY